MNNKLKENAYNDWFEMTFKSWTWDRLTDDERTMSEAEIKRANSCPNFMLTEDIITGREYIPRERKSKGKQVAVEMQQLSFEEV